MAFTLDDIKKMSPLRKTLVVCLIFLLLGYFYYSYFYEGLLEKKMKLADRISSIQQEIAEKQILIKQIEKYKKELAGLEKDLQVALTKLPEQKEIPGLLNSVSEAGRSVDLEFLLFRPMDPVSREFYAEIPIKIEVTGSYHNVALFFEKVAKLSRIMNIKDVSIKSKENMEDMSYTLVTSCLVKTYMFLEKVDENKK
ncbi:MAG: type 4a pilus biogenesis protein PilO [Thermodesulfobacteriota bacterium]|nr:type 4a pilus biogenesis protein PilO [Thermodesulfobacteriota bacterium]